VAQALSSAFLKMKRTRLQEAMPAPTTIFCPITEVGGTYTLREHSELTQTILVVKSRANAGKNHPLGEKA
jgi:hypothetical protein